MVPVFNGIAQFIAITRCEMDPLLLACWGVRRGVKELVLTTANVEDAGHGFFRKGHKYCLSPLEGLSLLIDLVSVSSVE